MINYKKGFTLLELLVVIAIIAILSVIIVIILNPAEILKKARDSQRISDLTTLKTALGIYVTASSTPDLDAAISPSICLTNQSGTNNTVAQISYSAEVADVTCTDAGAGAIVKGSDGVGSAAFSTTDHCRMVGTTGASNVDGTGWVPVNLGVLIGGSPLSNLPIDPVNTISASPTSTDLVYRYVCQQKATGGKPSYVFEFNAQLESDEFTSIDDKRTKDGGDTAALYEVGNSVKLITGTNY